jgi:MFS transporter, NRE family, putaive nickel resistance protein
VPGLWRNRTFTLLFWAQAMSLAGSGVTTVALALMVHKMAGPATATAVLGQALMLRIAAFLLFSQPAGILADRLNRKAILLASDLSRLVILAFFPFITTVWQVYAAVFVLNSLTAFFTPAFDASLPEIVGDDLYVKALSYSRVTVDIEAIAGPAIAGLLVAVVGLRWVFWFDAATYLVSAIMISFVAVPGAGRQQGSLAPSALWKELTYGTRVLLRNPSIRQALLMSLAEAMAGASAIVVTIVYVRDFLHGTELQYSLTMAAVGAGSAICAVGLGRITARMERAERDGSRQHALRHLWSRRSLFVGGLALAASLLPASASPSLMLFGLLWILNGAGQALVAIPTSTLVASHTQPDERGRAFAAHFAITHACWLVSYPLTGRLAERIGPTETFLVCGLACLAITAMAFVAGLGRRNAHGILR